MTTNHSSSSDRITELVANSTGEHWIFFLVEGAALIFLGLLAIIVPALTDANVTAVLGWLFLIAGAIGLATTYWTRRAPGIWWSLVSALLAILVGVVLTAHKAQDLYGGLMGWPFEKIGSLRQILVLFFLSKGARRSCSLSSTDVSSLGAGPGCWGAVSSTLSWRVSLFSIFQGLRPGRWASWSGST